VADPQKFTPGYSYTNWQTSNPTKPLPGNKVDQDMANIAMSTESLANALKDIRRSDGKLKNGVVTVDSLDPQVAAGVGSGALASAAAAAAAAGAASDSQAAADGSAYAAAESAAASSASATEASGHASTALVYRNDAAAAATLSQTARDYAYQWSSQAEGVDVNDGVNPVGKSAYHWAQVALGAATGALPDNSVSTPKIVDGALSADAAGRAKMADGFVTSAKILDANVTTAKLAANALSADAAGLGKMADGFLQATTGGRAKMADGFLTLAKLDASVTGLLVGRNLIINGQSRVNQRVYVSGTNTTVANQYTLDRWRVGTSGQNLTFTGDDSRRVITAPAGGVEQVIEGLAVLGGTYVLNWTGTATATVNGTARAKGETFTLPANTNATVRLSGGTFSDVQLELGSAPTVYERLSFQQELALCQRYGEAGSINFGGLRFASNTANYSAGDISFAVKKRVVPSVAFAGVTYLNCSAATAAAVQDSKFSVFVTPSTSGVNFQITAGTYFADAEL
jgi:hypothetical protein